MLRDHEIDASLTRKQNRRKGERDYKVKTSKADGMIQWGE